MLSFLDLALINVLRELDDAEMSKLMPRLERSAGPPEEVQMFKGFIRFALIADGLR